MMKAVVLSTWIAAGLLVAASGAKAQQADCDLICRLQGYLSTDHMAAKPADAASAATPAKRHPRAASAAKPPRTEPKVAARPAATIEAKAVAKAPAEAAAKAKTKTAEAGAPAIAEAKGLTKPASTKPAITQSATVSAAAPRPPLREVATAAPPKHHVTLAAVTPPDPAPPAAAATPKRSRRVARAIPRIAREDAPHPVASAALIPGSAPLVPAEFQAFGNL